MYIAGPAIGAAIAVAIIGAVRGLPDKDEREAAKAAPCRFAAPPPRTATEMAGQLRLGEVPATSMRLACVIGVAAACDIAREDAGLLAAIVMGWRWRTCAALTSA